ncbi:hypothetical protein [Rhodoblastus sp.]|uniref:hypothetical protein n=1 Tax=Rhodoblastus sp. TaxID=1962975 RepID=UPI003F99F28C
MSPVAALTQSPEPANPPLISAPFAGRQFRKTLAGTSPLKPLAFSMAQALAVPKASIINVA